MAKDAGQKAKKKKKKDGGEAVVEAPQTQGDPELAAARTERTRGIVARVGNTVGAIAVVIALGILVAILVGTAQDVSIGSVIEDDRAGTMTIATPFLILVAAMIAFFFGQFATRGRWGVSSGSVWQSGTFKVVLKPLSVPLHVVFLVIAVLAWFLVLPLPVLLEQAGIIDPAVGSSSAEQFWFAVTVYGVVSGAIAAIIGVSLIKKLTYNRSLEQHRGSIVDGSPSQVFWRRFSHIWRSELMLAALAGAALGLSPLGIHLDSPAYGWGALAIGLVLLAGSIGLALNSWRSGLPVERVESYT